MSTQACQSARTCQSTLLCHRRGWRHLLGRQHVLVCGMCVVVLVPKYIGESSKTGAGGRLFHAIIVVGYAFNSSQLLISTPSTHKSSRSSLSYHISSCSCPNLPLLPSRHVPSVLLWLKTLRPWTLLTLLSLLALLRVSVSVVYFVAFDYFHHSKQFYVINFDTISSSF